MDFRKIAPEYKDEMVEKLCELIKFKSTLVEQPEVKEAPFGYECKEALEYVLNLGKSMGFVTKNVDNICGHIEYGEGEEIIGILCHADVVPAVGEWVSDPYTARIENDKLYARGSIDDKGPLISSLYALKILKDNNIKLNKKVRLIIGTDEESGSRGLKRYLEVEKMPDLGFSPDADFPLIYGEKGIMSMDIISENEPDSLVVKCGDRYNIVPDKAVAQYNKCLSGYSDFLIKNNYNGEVKDNQMYSYGKAFHAMEPNGGINAALHLSEYLKNESPLMKFACEVLCDSRLKTAGLNFTDSEMGDLTCNFAVLNIENNVGKIGLNYRYPVRWDKEEFLKKFTAKCVEYDLKVEVLSDSKPHYISPSDPLITKLMGVYQEYTGDYKTPMKTIGGGTYARGLKRAVAFGQVFPGEEDLAHVSNEYISISKMVLSCAIYAKAIVELSK